MDIEKSLRTYPPRKKKHKPRVSHQFSSVRRERETEKMAKKTLQLPTSLEIFFASSSEIEPLNLKSSTFLKKKNTGTTRIHLDLCKWVSVNITVIVYWQCVGNTAKMNNRFIDIFFLSIVMNFFLGQNRLSISKRLLCVNFFYV